MSEDVLVRVEGVSKKFCRSLKRSLWYGLQDVGAEMFGRPGRHDELRKNEFWAVNDVSFELERGECLGLIGPNGAGKSTLLKMLNGLVKPDKGRITMRGRVGALIELGAGFNPILTARENIYVNGSVLGFSKKEIDRKFDAIVDFAEVEEFIDTPVQNYSSGMKVRLGFGVAGQMNPDILLIDEVLAVGDVEFRMKCFERVIQLKERGAAIVLVSHSPIDINRTSDRVVVLSRGELDCDTDVSRGISAYQRACAQSLNVKVPKESNTSIQLRNVSINQCNELEAELLTEDRLDIEFRVESAEPQKNCRIWLGIYCSGSGMIASFSSAEDDFPVEFSQGHNSVILSIPSLPLGVGHYTISCGIYGPKITDVYDFREGIGSFNVIGPRPETFGYGSDGIVRISHLWCT